MASRLPRMSIVRDDEVHVALGRGEYAIVDRADGEAVAAHVWIRRGDYATTKIAERHVRLHVFLMSPPPWLEVDHRNGNGLDCRRSNMRFATHQQNGWNTRKPRGSTTSKYKGVSRNRSSWVASIKTNGKTLRLGSFASEQAAAMAYDDAARRIGGEFACVNFPSIGERGALE